jgi:hypothetical protein
MTPYPSMHRTRFRGPAISGVGPKKDAMYESSHDKLKKYRPAFAAMEAGVLDGIECPECGKEAASVRFTHPQPAEYRTWLVCRSCGFKLRLQTVGVPSGFSKERVDEYLEAYDVDLLKKRKM